MRQVNAQILSGADTGNVNGSQIDSNQLISASFQAVFGDTSAVGTFKIQASNDVAALQISSSSTYIVTDWSDIPSASVSITAGGSALITLPNLNYRWIRAVYVSSSGGSSTVVVNMFGFSTV
jgi:hypothetical protein